MSNNSEFFINLDKLTKERFALGKFMEFTDNHDPLTSSFIDVISNLPQRGVYEVKGEDGRPDLLSYRIYGNTQYWWILLIYNRKIDYREITTGELIRYPSIDSLEDIYFSLKAKQTGRI